MDNCKIHKKDEFDCEKLCSENNIELWFLPPYIPELNMIEYVFSMLKNNIRKSLATTYRNQLLVNLLIFLGKIFNIFINIFHQN